MDRGPVPHRSHEVADEHPEVDGVAEGRAEEREDDRENPGSGTDEDPHADGAGGRRVDRPPGQVLVAEYIDPMGVLGEAQRFEVHAVQDTAAASSG